MFLAITTLAEQLKIIGIVGASANQWFNVINLELINTAIFAYLFFAVGAFAALFSEEQRDVGIGMSSAGPFQMRPAPSVVGHLSFEKLLLVFFVVVFSFPSIPVTEHRPGLFAVSGTPSFSVGAVLFHIFWLVAFSIEACFVFSTPSTHIRSTLCSFLWSSCHGVPPENAPWKVKWGSSSRGPLRFGFLTGRRRVRVLSQSLLYRLFVASTNTGWPSL